MNTIRLNTIGEVVAKKTSGGAEINNQEKTIDITENGTTEVAPDNGFTGLSKVIVNTDVQGGETGGGESGSGGGEGGSGGGSDVIYIDMRGYENFTYPSVFSDCVKLIKDEQTVWMPGGEYVQSPNDAISPIAICVYTNKKISYGLGQPIGQLLTYGELITMMGLGAVMELPRITEEEFYNLNA